MNEQPVYIYAFCEPAPKGLVIEGLRGEPVRFVEHAGVCAAVSDAPQGRIRPQRRMLASHQQVLSSLAALIPTLPAAFGLVAESAELLEAAMCDNAMALRGELDRVGRCVEMDLRLAWDTESTFEHLVSLDEALRDMREQLVGLGEAAPHQLRVNVGRRVEAVLAVHRDASVSAITEAIGPACREVETMEPSTENELAKLAVLVAREEQDAFEKRVAEAAERFDESHVFRLAGPFAPHSFVDLHLNLSNSRIAA